MTNIVVLGGGFGGVRAALDLEKKLGQSKDIRIILIDQNNAQTFYPALYELASVFGVDHEHPYHTKLKGMIAIPYSEIFKGTGVELIQAKINRIDLENKHITTDSEMNVHFDYLIIALGAVASTFGIPGAEEYAFKFKSVEDGLMLSDKLEQIFDTAGKDGKMLPVKILVGGAGFTGVELASELANCSVHIAHRHKITQKNCTAITLIEAAPMMLPMVSDSERAKIKNRLNQLGVTIMENSPIEEVMSGSVKLKNGHILAGDIVIWSAGTKPLEMLKEAKGLELDDRGRILVNENLQAKNYNSVFAVGDNIIFIDAKNNKPVPQMAFVAIEQGSIAAENIARIIEEQIPGGEVPRVMNLKSYKPNYDVWVAPVGAKYALFHMGRWGIGGFVGYVLREIVDLRYFIKTLPFIKGLKLFFEDIRVFTKND
jgi:NADH dehydrogenase